jgi:hypothetical protein
MEGMRNAYNTFVGKPEGKRPLGRRRQRWEDNIKRDLSEMGGKVSNELTWFRIGTSGGFQ